MRNQFLQSPKPQTLLFPSLRCIRFRPPIFLFPATQVPPRRTISQSLLSTRLPSVSTLSATSRLDNLNRQFSGESMATANGKAGTTARLANIRNLMKEKKVDVYGTIPYLLFLLM